MTDDKLRNIRDRLDDIDVKIQNLLTQRAQISLEVREIKKTDEAKLKPGREAQIMRTLVERHHGDFPRLELISIWREILSASVKLQGIFKIAVYKPETGSDENWGYISSARGHFGSQTPITTYSSQRRVVEAVLENECSIGILPTPIRNEDNPWWRHLAVQGNTVKNGEASKPARIISKLPFAPPTIEYGQFGTGSTDCVVISKGEADPSGLDDTYIVLDLAENVSSTRIDTRLTENNMSGSTVSIWHDSEAPERWLCLIRIKGFILSNDNKLDRLAEGFNEILNQVTILGSYAVPLDAETLNLDTNLKRD